MRYISNQKVSDYCGPKNVKIKNMYNDDVSLDVIVFSITSEKIEFDNKIFNEKDYLGEIYNTDKKLYRNQKEMSLDITSNIFYAEQGRSSS